MFTPCLIHSIADVGVAAGSCSPVLHRRLGLYKFVGLVLDAADHVVRVRVLAQGSKSIVECVWLRRLVAIVTLII